jgi:hypothetical protein
MKQTIIRTKDNKQLILSHDQPFTDAELDQMREMTSREIYHVGKVRGIRLED